MKRKSHFLGEESGQGMVEYSLILVLIAMAAFMAYRGIGETNLNRMQGFADQIPK